MSAFATDLLALATKLLGAKASSDVLTATCREVQRLAGVDVLYGSIGTIATWGIGEHLRFAGTDSLEVTPAQKSALFAVHRSVARTRQPLTLSRDSDPTVLDALCGEQSRSQRLVAFPITRPQGRIVGCLALCVVDPLGDDVMGVLVDMTTLAATALDNVRRITSARRDRERLNLLAEAAEEALWDWTPGTGEFWWGGGVQTLLGDVLLQSRLSWKFEQIHPDDAPRVRDSFERTLRDTAIESWREEYRQRRTDGTWIHVEDRAHILRDSDGKAHRVVGALRDVSELRALLAREHAARAEAERASLAKDEFLAMLGHELRNPLSPIVSTLYLLRLRNDPETMDRGLTILERQARHLTRLVDDLLDVARIAQGKVLLECAHIDLAEVVDTALETAYPLIQDRRHEVQVLVARDLRVNADRARMQQVIGNLITNAAKYTPQGGRIFIEGRIVESQVELRVADTGIGISAEMLGTVFDSFVQGRQELDRMHGGLGLGLAIVRNLVHLHHGSVEARSAGEGLGAEFIVRLPVARADALVVPSGVSGTLAHDVARRLLIVDDNQDAADSLASLLAVAGYETRVVHDGPTALSAVEEMDPDVVLLDLGLPVIDGYQVAREVRRRRGPDRPRLIAVTGYGHEHDRRRSREAGFDAHLVKPVQIDRLREVIAGTE